MGDRHPYVGEKVWRALPNGIEAAEIRAINYNGRGDPWMDISLLGTEVTVGGVSLEYYRKHFHPWPPPPDLTDLDLVEEWLDE